MPTADNPDEWEQAVRIFGCPDLCMIKDAIANIARNREVLHFLSCIARFLGHFSGLATNRQSGLLPFSRRTPTSYLASHNFVSLLPRDNVNSAVALKPLPYRLNRRCSQTELQETKPRSQYWREG